MVLQKCKIKVASFYILITALGKNQTLRSIDFSHNNLSGGKNPQNMHTLISTNKDLVSLSLQECMLGDEHLASLARGFGPSSRLQKLLIPGNQMSQVSLEYFCESMKMNRNKLTYLDIGNNPNIQDEDFVAFCG